MKTKYTDLKGVSAKLSEEDLKNFKARMADFKTKHGGGFSVSDLLQAVTYMPIEILDAEIKKFISTRSPGVKALGKLDISDEAKARIEAILAEEALKKG